MKTTWKQLASEKATKTKEALSRGLDIVLRKILKERVLPLQVGDEVPYRSALQRTTTRNVADVQEVEREVRAAARKYASKNPQIFTRGVSVDIPREGYATFTLTGSSNNPVLEEGKSYVFWGHPDSYRKALGDAGRTAKNKDELKRVNVIAFKKLVTKNCLALYAPGIVKNNAEQTRQTASQIVQTLDTHAALTGEVILPPINWEEKARNAVVIEVSRKVVGKKKVAGIEMNVIEPSIQIYDPLTGEWAFAQSKSISELLQEHRLESVSNDEEKRTAMVLSGICKKYAGKTALILYRDESRDGGLAVKIARHLSTEHIYPFFDEEGVQRVKEVIPEKPRRSRAAQYSIAASALVLAGGITGYALRGVPDGINSVLPTAAEKTIKISVETSHPNTDVETSTSSSFFGGTKVKIHVQAHDPDRIKKIVAYASGGKRKGNEPLFTRRYEGNETKTTVEFEESVGGSWEKGKSYSLRIEVTDAKGNVGTTYKTINPSR